MISPCKQLTAVVFDWAGTTVDHGCCAPALVFQKIFAARGIEVTAAQAREPMGKAKRDHIAAIAAMPDVAAAWKAKFGSPCGDAEIDELYAEFLPLQKQILKDYSDLIPGVAEAVNQCRERGLKIGSSTGYTPELMEVVIPEAQRQGYEPDCVLCSGDTAQGRPAPYMLHSAAEQLGVWPMWSIVKVDDTPVGIEAGRNAGCWTVGITRTGNGVGLSLEETEELPAEELQSRCEAAAGKLRAAGAHYILESVADLPALIPEIEQRLANGESPVTV
ncbi:MAG: phosphonoacetaldehyde hydrolase [Planctomycetaceae bacterium]|nr:phosphonoacetaldehyde hydrolase [Planctomycetaceae bacterium]